MVKILDLKCPGSGEVERNLWSNLDLLSPRDEIKFVLLDRRDYEWARDVIHERKLGSRARLLMSPVHGALEPRELVAWILADSLPARLNLQLHKVVWPPTKSGRKRTSALECRLLGIERSYRRPGPDFG